MADIANKQATLSSDHLAACRMSATSADLALLLQADANAMGQERVRLRNWWLGQPGYKEYPELFNCAALVPCGNRGNLDTAL